MNPPPEDPDVRGPESLDFDPISHRYFLGGREVPSVTTVIKDLKFSWYPGGKSSVAKMNAGTKVHSLTEADDRGVIPRASACHSQGGPDLLPYLEAWREFRRVFGGWIEAAELRVVSDVHRFAGTVDRVFSFPSGESAIVDIKTGGPARWHRLQTAAYVIAATEGGLLGGVGSGLSREDIEGRTRRLCVYLKDSGEYKIREHNDPADLHAWKNAVRLWHWTKT